MCLARHARQRARAAPGPRATAPARPLNNEGRHDQSSGEASGPATERVGKHASTDRPDNQDRPGEAARPEPRPRRPLPPDDRLTTILPPVVDDRAPRRRDPLEEVKAALDGPASTPTPRDAIDEVK